MVAYAIIAPPGPAWAMAPPLAKNRPVPIAPPMAIMLNCRVPILRWSPQGSFDVAARFDVMPRAWHTVAGSARAQGFRAGVPPSQSPKRGKGRNGASPRSVDRQLALRATRILFGKFRFGFPLGSHERLELGCG